MESNNFDDVINVIWDSLIANASSLTSGNLYLDSAALVLLGIACVFATRRYLPTLASARSLQPAGAIEIQKALRAAPVPLAATAHNAKRRAINATAPRTPLHGGSSHAA